MHVPALSCLFVGMHAFEYSMHTHEHMSPTKTVENLPQRQAESQLQPLLQLPLLSILSKDRALQKPSKGKISKYTGK